MVQHYKQGLWSVQRLITADGLSEARGFMEVQTNLKGAKSGFTMFANEGRVGRVVLELAAAVRGRMGAKIMVETNMRRYDEGRRDGRKVGVATNLSMEEVAEDLVRLGREATYGGLQCFKVEEVEDVGN